MKTSKIFLTTNKKEESKQILTNSHKLMLQSNMIFTSTSGFYTWLPIGTMVINNVLSIIKNELEKIDSQEIIMPLIQPLDLLKQSNRLDKYKDNLFFLKDKNLNEFCLSPTHEEMISSIIKNKIHSYKQLPLILYQTQQKFRDETRPKHGTIRSKEFIMNDAYSFHSTEKCLDTTYKKMTTIYKKIFSLLNINSIIAKAHSGDMGGSISHEYHIINEHGDDEIIFNKKRIYNKEITKKKIYKNIKIEKGIEIGHTFKLNTYYSEKFNLFISNNNNTLNKIYMGCYGIGVSRLIAAIIEQNHDAKGIIWPKNIEPFKIGIIPINYHKSQKVKKYTDSIYNYLKKNNIKTILEDRNKSFGETQNDMDLIGIPNKLIINEKNLDKKNPIEYQKRNTCELFFLKKNEIINTLK